MKHRGSFPHRPIGWTPLTDNGQRDKRTNERKRTDGRTDGETRLFVRPSVRTLRWSLTLNSDDYDYVNFMVMTYCCTGKNSIGRHLKSTEGR